MLEHLNKFKQGNPVDLIVSQIRDLITSGYVKSGEKLPSERKLAEHLGVSRNHIREAIYKLQIYGIVKVLPQSGIVVSGLGLVAFESLISDFLKIENTDFSSLIDTNVLIEKETAKLAAINRTSDELGQLRNALDAYEEKLHLDKYAVDEYLLFHIKIAEAGKNSVLKSLMMIITPEVVKSIERFKVNSHLNNQKIIEEHRNILAMISARNPEGAIEAMQLHLSNNFS